MTPFSSVDPLSVQEPGIKLVCYCKDCRKIVKGARIGKKYAFKCDVCSTKNVAFGTEKSIKNFYNIAESGPVKA